MMEVLQVNAFDDNYIWLLRQHNRDEVLIVDPGEAGPVLQRLQHDGLKPAAILITHHHGDHTGGIRELLDYAPVPVYGPAGENIPHIGHPLHEGDTVGVAGLQLTVIDTPGHTRGHICYYGHGALFCGDTLFAGGCGRLFEGSAEQMHHSLEKIRALPDSTQVYCAHEYTLTNLGFALIAEPENSDTQQRLHATETLHQQGLATVPSTLELEKATNPFLRSHVPSLIDAAEQFAGHSLDSGAEVFATVRRWKDSLD